MPWVMEVGAVGTRADGAGALGARSDPSGPVCPQLQVTVPSVTPATLSAGPPPPGLEQLGLTLSLPAPSPPGRTAPVTLVRQSSPSPPTTR